jgi:cell wall-associated NlpC family hydrolase
MTGRLLLVVSLAAMTGACASSQMAFAPQPYPGSGSAPVSTPSAAPIAPVEPAEPVAPRATPDGRTIAEAALRERGRPYRLGGETPDGFDCSGLVQYVFAQYGLVLPREVREQFQVGERVKRAAIRPGDLVFFATEGRGASHVGIALGGGEFVHAPNARGTVRISRLDAPYWRRHFLEARRIDLRGASSATVAAGPP